MRVPARSASIGTMQSARTASIDLFWIPLGAGGHLVRFNGRIFEAVAAVREHRRRCDLYHAALIVALDGVRYAIELAPAWGRDEFRAGKMWNSNSVIAWLVARAGIATDPLGPPPDGRAPGWDAGVVVAQRLTDGTPAPEHSHDDHGGLVVVP